MIVNVEVKFVISGLGGGLHPNIHESGKGAQEYSFITNNTNFAEIVETAESAKKLLRNSL